jgi:CheY-like chemotaxis protein
MTSTSHAKLEMKLILVADDYRNLAKLVASLLRARLRCEAVGMCSGEEVLAFSAGRRPDACVLDINMPVIGGIGTARELRRMFPMGAPLLIAMSGEPEDAIRRSRLFDHVCLKPLNLQLLIDHLR